MDAPASGWDLVRIARLVIGRFWNVTPSQVYRELAALERDGLITGGSAGARERRPFRVRAAGRAAFLEWLRQPPGEEQIRHPLLLTISFGRHLPPGELERFLDEHRVAHARRLDEYVELERASDGSDPYTRATLDFGIRYERAVLEWFDHLPSDLTVERAPVGPS